MGTPLSPTKRWRPPAGRLRRSMGFAYSSPSKPTPTDSQAVAAPTTANWSPQCCGESHSRRPPRRVSRERVLMPRPIAHGKRLRTATAARRYAGRHERRRGGRSGRCRRAIVRTPAFIALRNRVHQRQRNWIPPAGWVPPQRDRITSRADRVRPLDHALRPRTKRRMKCSYEGTLPPPESRRRIVNGNRAATIGINSGAAYQHRQ